MGNRKAKSGSMGTDDRYFYGSTLFERLVNGEFFRVFVACQLFREELIQGL
jgi:hypothetical protein